MRVEFIVRLYKRNYHNFEQSPSAETIWTHAFTLAGVLGTFSDNSLERVYDVYIYQPFTVSGILSVRFWTKLGGLRTLRGGITVSKSQSYHLVRKATRWPRLFQSKRV
ncbi:hypothetical protein J6590_091321 [Homalodisca vitripennis]|nr:hypothetical protein J6590_091321 [Homalodisca vitripennis]